VVYRGEKLAGFPANEVSAIKAVQNRAFPLLPICGGADVVLPCRHSEKILRAAKGQRSCGECRLRCTPAQWELSLRSFAAA
jgi:hypothetical protein